MLLHRARHGAGRRGGLCTREEAHVARRYVLLGIEARVLEVVGEGRADNVVGVVALDGALGLSARDKLGRVAVVVELARDGDLGAVKRLEMCNVKGKQCYY